MFPKSPGREIAEQHGEPLHVNGGLLLHLTTAHQLELPPSAPEQCLLVTLLAVLTIHITSLLHHPIFVHITSNKFSIFNGYAKLSDMSTNKNGQYVFQVNKELKLTNQHKKIKNRHCTIFSKQYYNSKTGNQRINLSIKLTSNQKYSCSSSARVNFDPSMVALRMDLREESWRMRQTSSLAAILIFSMAELEMNPKHSYDCLSSSWIDTGACFCGG